ncbi:RNA recognition domain-containing protein [Pseudomassariella vexata]|uniref:U4/U6 snRNA-associated-splicing factor PRP24 n=1 Tax=Pseudomassariella vexata TaxID=1141098 RepID=A0A1Y2DCL3_9PEZI|nr:RNA recognition domain-containing protein [Pseudomassariella vexata]ORY56415.1 RNA recognition domain-containing protein [Pseudomassariella vexata]
MENVVGEDNWLAYVEEQSRHAYDLESRVKVVELFKQAIVSEPGSLKIWLAYCEWFWSLFTDCQSNEAGWPEEEQQLGRELFTFDAALSLWSEGYESIKYRLNDSHEFWNRWVSIEQEQLARTRTPVGVRRISHLFRDRLQVPHATWDNTSQMFSSFLSTYNNAAYESEFKEVTALAKDSKDAYELREPFELKLNRAARSGDVEAHKAIMKEYLDWEMAQNRKTPKTATLATQLCVGLYSRALTGVFAFEDEIWTNYVVYLSTMHGIVKSGQAQHYLPDMLGILKRAVSHCPWSGTLWSRYILCAEETGWAFHDVEHIKHTATNAKALDKNGMTGVLEMYAAWCGYLKRTAMNPNAPEDAVDIADVGFSAALEDVQLWGERLYKSAYQGDPNYRIERILIQYLTEKKGEIDAARSMWNRMAEKPLLADSYDFWLNYYLWEMVIFSSRPKIRSPTPANGTMLGRVPTLATNVLARALKRKTLDWPERVMEVYHQHCNDNERPETLHRALDVIHKTKRTVAKRRQQEQANAAAAYAAQTHVQPEAATGTGTDDATTRDSPSSSKRKRGATPEESAHPVTKRPKNAEVNGADAATNEQNLKRDRENTSVLVTNLPGDVTSTAVRKYFKEYGHIQSATMHKEAGNAANGSDQATATALIEFSLPEEAQSALLRDGKYFGRSQIGVEPGTGLTLYVTNYPPAADEDYIRNLFKHCGGILSIRLPSLKYNTHRRFCYISFVDQAAAAKGSELDGKLLEGKYKLVSQYSNPSRKKTREGATAEGREIRIKNLDPKASEGDIRSLLQKYGMVQSVNVLKNIGGTNVGLAYAVFETKGQAESAVDLDKANMNGRILDVELTKETNFKPFATSKGDSPSAASSPAPSADVAMAEGDTSNKPSSREIQDRTMALLNVPDTVNDARIRAFAEKHGDIVKIVLRPDHQGAIVEYADAATVGRAMLALDGYEIVPGRKLRTGLVADLFKTKAEQKMDRIVPTGGSKNGGNPRFMPPPLTIRRPALGGGGKRGGRHGLGFVAAKKPDEAGVKEAPVNGTAEAVKPKSNAEFKAMFLSGQGDVKKDVNGGS